MMKALKSLFCSVIISAIIVCTASLSQPMYTDVHSFRDHSIFHEPLQEPWITVFVHGMINVEPHLSIGNFCLFMRDDIIDTLYEHTVRNIRTDPFFYLNEAMGPMGWHKLDLTNLTQGMVSNATAHIYNEVSRLVGLAYNNNHYYTYGWSGLMSLWQRYEEAENLLVGLESLVRHHTKNGIRPKVRIIGYSHGGNVALNIAAIHSAKYPTMDIHVDELILLGMPVQIETDILTASPIFEKVYHFYSRLDRIQRLDLFSVNRIFSARTFSSRRSFKVPTKVTQVQVKFSRLRKSKKQHHDLHTHARDCSKTINTSGQRRSMRDVSPGHIELWFFGWTTGDYRDDFLITPLPVLALIPYMIAELNKLEGHFTNPHPIIFDMRPELDTSIIKQYHDHYYATTVPFVSHNDLEPLKELAYSIKPKNYTKQTYKEHTVTVMAQAYADYTIQKVKTPRPAEPHRRNRRTRRTRLNKISVNACDIVV